MMQAHQQNVVAYSAVPFVNSLMISSDNCETDPGGRTNTQTNQLLAYKRIEHVVCHRQLHAWGSRVDLTLSPLRTVSAFVS